MTGPAALAVLLLSAQAVAPAPPQIPPATPIPVPAPRPRAAAPATVVLTALVTTRSGQPIEGATVVVTGPVEREGITIPDGSVRLPGVRPGTYRVRFEAEGFVTFEKEVSWRAGQPPPMVEATLTAAPPPPEPEPAPAPEPVAVAPTPLPPGRPTTLSVPDFIEANLISGREPQKVSRVGCSAGAQGEVWQVREPWTGRRHDDAEVLLYVVGGEGTLRLDGRDVAVAAGSLAVVPRGTPYDLTRRGRTPLFLLATRVGPPCDR